MGDDDENACVRNIVREIMRELAPRKTIVNKNFVTYLTKLLLLNPNWGIGDDFFNQRENVQHFVKYVIDDLLKVQDDPRIVTTKIQFYYSCNLERMDYIIESTKKELRYKLSALKTSILNATNVESKEELEDLFKKIVFYITLTTGLGNPHKSKVFEDALVALKSILYDEELKEFAISAKNVKNIQLVEFTKIVAGIRLFNKDCDKGGVGIADLPELLEKAIIVIRGGTQDTLVLIMERVNLLTTIVDKCFIMKEIYNGHKMEYCSPTTENEIISTNKANTQIEYLKDLLIFFRQYELLIRNILDEIDQVQDKADNILKNMEKLMKLIHTTVHMKIAIPVGVVFPLFEQLWNIWEEFQNQGLLLSRLSMVMSNLETYAKNTHYDHVAIDLIMVDSPALTDVERLSIYADCKLTSSNSEIKIIQSDSMKNSQNIHFEYLGFCSWKLIETDGALIPGNPSMGIAVYKLKYYVFSCPEAFEEFSKDPQMCINCVLDLTRRKPHLINFFNMKQDLESVYNIEKLVQTKVEITMCEDKSLQTVVHTAENYIDSNYKWNIWDLKREALTNVTLLSCVTCSTQTDKTCSNNSIRTQTYDRKNIESQTHKDNYSNVPKPSVFLYGLRGRKDNQQFQIDLTRPIEEEK